MNELINFRYKELPKDWIDDDGKFDRHLCFNFPHKCLNGKKDKVKGGWI